MYSEPTLEESIMFEKSREIVKISEKAKKLAMVKVFTRMWLDKIDENPEEIFKYIKTYAGGELYDDVCANVRMYTGKKCECVMITVNPKQNINLELFDKLIKKCLKKKWIKTYMYCYEVRNAALEGLHVHIRLTFKEGEKISPGRCRRECYNTFKNIVGNYEHVDLKPGYRKDAFIDYIGGLRKGKEKDCWTASCIWRKLNGKEHVYSNFKKVESSDNRY